MITQNDATPIFLQIKRWIEDHILRGEWSAETQLPSVRELAAEFGVNPNTVARTYERLTLEETVRSVRGVGFFVGDKAKETIVSRRREEFIKQSLPSFIEQMMLLDVKPEEIINAYNNRKDENRN